MKIANQKIGKQTIFGVQDVIVGMFTTNAPGRYFNPRWEYPDDTANPSDVFYPGYYTIFKTLCD